KETVLNQIDETEPESEIESEGETPEIKAASPSDDGSQELDGDFNDIPKPANRSMESQGSPIGKTATNVATAQDVSLNILPSEFAGDQPMQPVAMPRPNENATIDPSFTATDIALETPLDTQAATRMPLEAHPSYLEKLDTPDHDGSSTRVKTPDVDSFRPKFGGAIVVQKQSQAISSDPSMYPSAINNEPPVDQPDIPSTPTVLPSNIDGTPRMKTTSNALPQPSVTEGELPKPQAPRPQPVIASLEQLAAFQMTSASTTTETTTTFSAPRGNEAPNSMPKIQPTSIPTKGAQSAEQDWKMATNRSNPATIPTRQPSSETQFEQEISVDARPPLQDARTLNMPLHSVAAQSSPELETGESRAPSSVPLTTPQTQSVIPVSGDYVRTQTNQPTHSPEQNSMLYETDFSLDDPAPTMSTRKESIVFTSAAGTPTPNFAGQHQTAQVPTTPPQNSTPLEKRDVSGGLNSNPAPPTPEAAQTITHAQSNTPFVAAPSLASQHLPSHNSGAQEPSTQNQPTRLERNSIDGAQANLKPIQTSAQSNLASNQANTRTITTEMTNAVASKNEDASVSLLAPVDTPELVPWDTSKSTAIPPATALRSDLSPQITRQLIDAAPQAVNRPVEIALSPEELGRVRMSIVTEDNSITINIIAERGDTIDLMRRHIDQLGQSFRSLGYDQINFSFGQGAQGGDQNTDSGDQPAANPRISESESNATHPDSTVIDITHAPSTGVDIRL
ncbi:MAG: flagellar hook-length control protein FliK, partial [Sulfitobacter sp.]